MKTAQNDKSKYKQGHKKVSISDFEAEYRQKNQSPIITL